MGKKIALQRKPIVITARPGSAQISELKKRFKVFTVADFFSEQLTEVFEIRHPLFAMGADMSADLNKFRKNNPAGNWIYFPWNGTLLHTLKEKDLFSLRTNRNKNLITEKEQETLAKFTVAIAGLSIGGNMAVNLAYSGTCSSIKIADHDTLRTTNLNRVRAKLSDVGTKKIDIISRQIYEINPYAKISGFDAGISAQNLKKFVAGKPKPQLIFDAIDDFEMKVRLRQEARKAKIPVVMLTSLGDNLLIDIERYDLEPKLALFNGLIGTTPEEILSKPVSEEDKNRYAVQIVGRENVPERAIESLREIGKTLVGRPQLLSTVMVGSGAASFLVRQIALGKSLKSGRKLVRFEQVFHI